jgi:MFS family permease
MGVFVEITNWKMPLLLGMTFATVFLSILSVNNVTNPGLLIFFKALQGAVMTILPPTLNAVALGLVGNDNFPKQVALNEVASHAGTVLLNLAAGGYAYVFFEGAEGIFYLPIVNLVFLTFLVAYFQFNCKIDEDLARGLVKINSGGSKVDEQLEMELDMMSYDTVSAVQRPQTKFRFNTHIPFLFFSLICMMFHLSNAVALPLTMQIFAEVNKNKGGDGGGEGSGDGGESEIAASPDDFLLSCLTVCFAQAM